MGEPTLDAIDRAILQAVGDAPADVETLAADLDVSRDDLRDRLATLADNALVEESSGEYDLTENGARFLAAPGDGSRDDRIDTPAAVEEAVDALDLPPDRADAVRSAFAFLRYWGDATAAELVDAGYTEAPAGYDDADAWWHDLVRDALADLPDVTSPGDGDRWRYEGTPGVSAPDADGRDAPVFGPGPAGSARHAIESAQLDDAERAAARAAFAALFERGTATEDEIRAAAFEEHPAGYDDPDAWWEGFLRDALAAVPAVECDGDEWRYAER